jgi:hypothetical protein
VPHLLGWERDDEHVFHGHHCHLLVRGRLLDGVRMNALNAGKAATNGNVDRQGTCHHPDPHDGLPIALFFAEGIVAPMTVSDRLMLEHRHDPVIEIEIE